jgi:hypothetical protein
VRESFLIEELAKLWWRPKISGTVATSGAQAWSLGCSELVWSGGGARLAWERKEATGCSAALLHRNRGR